MPVTFTRLPLKGDIVPPVRDEDLGPYPLAAMVFSGDRVVWADSYDELVATFSRRGEEYLREQDPRARQQLRGQWLVGCQIQLQAYICAEAQMNGDWDTLTEREKTALLGRRTLDEQPHDFGVEHLLGVDLWNAEVPLVVLVGHGAAEWPVVTSNDALVIFDCGGHGPRADERAIRSLARSGYLRLWTATVGG